MRSMAASLSDPLTSLGNRRQFTDFCDDAFPPDMDGTLIGVFIDLDNFKRLNDSKGHDAGDEALVCTGRIIRETIRESDLACRIGGEEFAILLNTVTPREGVAIAERVRAAIERELERFDVTASIGVTASMSGETAADFIRRGDVCMYHAKQSGKNRISTSWDNTESDLEAA